MQGSNPIETLLPSQLALAPNWEQHRRRQWAWTGFLIAIVIWGLTDVRRRARIDPENPTAHKTDFTVYTEAGAAFFDGRDPYEVSNPRGWHYLYPPLFAILLAPLAALDTQTQAVVWYFVSVAACFGMWRECRRMWRWLSTNAVVASTGPPERDQGRSLQSTIARDDKRSTPGGPPIWLDWLATATVALPVMNCLQRGQVGVVLGYLLIVGLRLVIASETVRGVFVGGVALAMAVTIKLTPILPAGILALLLLAKAWRNHH
ncbi:MAG TPA: glycosyltransferase 87 family protein, partial [Pirellulales bacterium]|nr:glycosyltransferase 87 family protein [Pirellulales bacterium]